MIDVHCHVLPGIDDGPEDDEQSAALLAALAEQGVEIVTATPHLRQDFPKVVVGEIQDNVKRLRNALSGRPSPAILPGAEVSLAWAQAASEEDLLLATLGQRGRYLLVETPYGAAHERFDEALLNLRLRGPRIVLAHPERNVSYQDDPSRLAQMVKRGVLLQVNASSFLSAKRGSRSRRLAHALVQEGMAHIVASDAHRADWRPPLLKEAVELLSADGSARVEWMTKDVPAAVIAGADVPDPPVGRARAGLSSLRRR